jgi:hypothetical protein
LAINPENKGNEMNQTFVSYESNLEKALPLLGDAATCGQALALAEQALDQARAQGATPQAQSRIYAVISRALGNMNQHQEVLQRAKQWIEAEPDSPDLRYYMADAFYRLDKFDQVPALVGEYLELLEPLLPSRMADPQDGTNPGEMVCTSLTMNCISLWQIQKQQDSLQLFNRILDIQNPEDAAEQAMAEAQRQGLSQLAAEMSSMLAKRRPAAQSNVATEPEAYQAEAARSFEEAGQEGQDWLKRARSLAQSGQMELAAMSYEEYLAIVGADVIAQQELSRIYQQLGCQNKARKLLK